MPRGLDDIDWPALTTGPFHPSPASWSDEVLYFLLVDRFSDAREDGYLDTAGTPVPGSTPAFDPATDAGSAIATDAGAAGWRAAGATWVGGTLQGVRSKLGYLKRLGVTALWISPVLRQRPGTDDYHGYGIQDFLQVEPRFGTDDDLVDLVRDAHGQGLYVILDVVFNHTADTFAYEQGDPVWSGSSYAVRGWRDEAGAPTLPFPAPVGDRGDAAVWPAELQGDGTYTCRGQIAHWDDDPEYRQGDFFGYKDVWHGSGPTDGYAPSNALLNLAKAYSYWIARADLDGFRIDTVKHMDPGATRFITSAVHEFAQSIGKDSFFLVGEITGARDFAVELMEATGLDAALGLADVQGQLESVAKGWSAPAGYFDLFRNSLLVGQGSHTWFRDRVVTSYDDHDQVRKGNDKARFAADPWGRQLALAVLALNVLSLGVPCVYYGSEQRLDGAGGNDRYIREALFGGAFGAFRSSGRHVFDETGDLYGRLAELLAVRRQETALRRGRQYLRPISVDGVFFGLPERLGGRIESVIAWSRILSDREVVCAINTDTLEARTVWVTVDHALHHDGQAYVYRYCSDPALTGSVTPVLPLNGMAVRVSVPPGGAVVLTPVS